MADAHPALALAERFASYGEKTALIFKDQPYRYSWLAQEVARAASIAKGEPGRVLALSSDYSPKAVALLLALVGRGDIVALITEAIDRDQRSLWELAQVDTALTLDRDDQLSIEMIGHSADHALLRGLKGRGGLILFSSGSSGKSKAVVHDGVRFLDKFKTPRRATVTIPFMVFDHIGGVNTLLHVLSSGGTAVLPPDRSPKTICELVERHRVEVLPTTPTFINLLLMNALDRYDLSSLAVLAYGAERMPASALERLQESLPNIKLMQNYGLSEVGIMRTQSESSGSLWMKIGGDGFETRVVDGLLQIKARTAMVGYLNEASPFTADGWLKTGDRVEVKGEYLRILGRASDIIIIGGEKVYPAEVEDLIASMSGVIDVVVSGQTNAITGQLVKAEVYLRTGESKRDFRTRMQAHLTGKIADYKIPQRVKVRDKPLHNARFKKVRSTE